MVGGLGCMKLWIKLGRLGHLIVSCILLFHGSYTTSFAVLLIPALCALSLLAAAWVAYPHPEHLEVEAPKLTNQGLTKKFWLYIAAICCVATGYVDFPLIAYHFQKTGEIPAAWMAAFFAIAMAAGGIGSLVCGRLYDTRGFSVLIIITGVSAFFVPLVFGAHFYSALLGMILWGIGIGSQESIMRAALAGMVAMRKRGTAYGLMNIWFGIFWFLGSALMGFLYDISIPALIFFSMGAQFAAIPVFIAVNNCRNHS